MEMLCSSQGEAGELERMSPTLAGRWRTVLCWQSWAVLVQGHISAQQQGTPTAHPCLRLQVPVFLATMLRDPGKKYPFALKGMGGLLSSQVWTGVFQVLLFRCSSFGPTISRLYLHFPFPHQQHLHEAGQKKGKVLWWPLGRDFQLCPRAVNSSKMFSSSVGDSLMSSSFS